MFARRCGESSSRRSRSSTSTSWPTPTSTSSGWVAPPPRLVSRRRWHEGASTRRRDRRRRRGLLGRLLAGPPRLGRRGALRARRPDERLDLPLGRARRPAARFAFAHAHDDGLGRPLPVARRGGRPRDRLARGRLAPPCFVRGADAGAGSPGRLGQDLRPAARPHLRRGSPGALPADVHRRRARGGLVMGGYERHPAPWGLDGIPPDFNGKLLAEDWDRFEELMTNALVRVPELRDAEVIRLVNGPEAFTPDGEFILGPTELPGFWVASGFCGHS